MRSRCAGELAIRSAGRRNKNRVLLTDLELVDVRIFGHWSLQQEQFEALGLRESRTGLVLQHACIRAVEVV